MPSPLAERIRPKRIEEFYGQTHLVGENAPITLMLKSKDIHSMIFWGPPGSGKTTLARIIANQVDAYFFEMSAVSAGKSDIRKVVESAKRLRDRKTILFLDEIHRFNKAQQDYLLPYVEDGTIILIGATTENPSFEIIPPLLSRAHVFIFKPLENEEIKKILLRAKDMIKIEIEEDAIDLIANNSNGDARQALSILEMAYDYYGKRRIKKEMINAIVSTRPIRYDQRGDEHYETISAYIKSMRAGDVDAALYYLARMVEAGEDPKFIARRMIIFASEDIGMAQPTALVVANEVFKAVEVVGYPECAINLAHGTVYLTLAKKDRSTYDAYKKALEDVKKYGNLPILLELRNAPTQFLRELGYGRGYEKYPKGKSLLPEKLKGRRYYRKDGKDI